MTDEKFLQIVAATPLVSIDLIVRDERGRILLGHRLNRPAQGFWFVPGGRIRKNERVAEALQRISQRELGTMVGKAALVDVFDHLYEDNFLGVPGIDTHYVVLAFAAELSSDILLAHDDQHAALRWWAVEDLLRFNGRPRKHESIFP